MDVWGRMKFTKLYNDLTGANMTHWEMQDLGILEESRIMAAIEIWSLEL